MPYTSKKTGKNEITVMKKDSGEIVGHTTPAKYNAYMAALHIHEQPDHMCHGGCAGYAEGGVVDEKDLEKRGFGPSAEAKALADLAESGAPLGADPMAIDAALKSPQSQASVAAQLSNALKSGATGLPGVMLGGILGELTNPDTSYAPIAPLAHGKTTKGYSEGGIVDEETPNEEHQRVEIPEEVKDYIDKAHKMRSESRPDENWRIKPMTKNAPNVPYKQDEKKPHFDEGSQGLVGDDPQVDPNKDLTDIAPAGTGMLAPAPAAPVQPPEPPPVENAPVATPPVQNAPRPAPAAPALTDQDYMDRANKLLGLNPEQTAGFMKLLGQNQQKSQIGAGIAGIGDAIASGGTLGKVNPGAMNRAEDIAQNATKQGLEGEQTIRSNQAQSRELADKLEERDPNSPFSKWVQQQYKDSGIGKKLGLDLSHVSAGMMAQLTGTGVEALRSDYEQQLKMAQLGLQKEQIEATKANEEAERRQEDIKNILAHPILSALGKVPSAASSTPSNDRVTVISPTGQLGHIPASKLKEALAKGYKQQ